MYVFKMKCQILSYLFQCRLIQTWLWRIETIVKRPTSRMGQSSANGTCGWPWKRTCRWFFSYASKRSLNTATQKNTFLVLQGMQKKIFVIAETPIEMDVTIPNFNQNLNNICHLFIYFYNLTHVAAGEVWLGCLEEGVCMLPWDEQLPQQQRGKDEPVCRDFLPGCGNEPDRVLQGLGLAHRERHWG